MKDVCLWSISILPSAKTHPTSALALTLALTLTMPLSFGGLVPRLAAGRQGRSRGSAACFGGVLPETPRAAERPASGPIQTDIRHEIVAYPPSCI